MFEFVSLLEKTREKSIYMRRQAADEADESLRACIPFSQSSHPTYHISATYTTPVGSTAVTFVDNVPVENPPSYDN